MGDLIEALQGHNPEARVVLGTQPNYPFECGIDGVVTRKEGDPDAFKCEDCEGFMVENDEGTQLECTRCPSHKPIAGADERPDDVFILESGQIRYASSKLWDAS